MRIRAARGLVIAAVALALLVAPAGAGERLRLRFDWPVGLTAQVALAAQIRDARGAKSGSTMRRVGYRMVVEDAPEGRLVRFSHPEVLTLVPRDDPLLRLLPAFLSSLVIDERGRIVRLAELDAMRESFRALVEASPEVLAEYEERTAPEAARAAVERRWQLLAASWLPEELELGIQHRAESSEPSRYGDVAMPLDVRWTASKRVPCHEGETEPRCVEILYQAMTDRERLREALAQRSGGGDPDWDAAVVRRIRLVTEPDGLVPHRADLLLRERLLVDSQPPVATDRHYIWVFVYPDR